MLGLEQDRSRHRPSHIQPAICKPVSCSSVACSSGVWLGFSIGRHPRAYAATATPPSGPTHGECPDVALNPALYTLCMVHAGTGWVEVQPGHFAPVYRKPPIVHFTLRSCAPGARHWGSPSHRLTEPGMIRPSRPAGHRWTTQPGQRRGRKGKRYRWSRRLPMPSRRVPLAGRWASDNRTSTPPRSSHSHPANSRPVPCSSAASSSVVCGHGYFPALLFQDLLCRDVARGDHLLSADVDL